MKKQIPFFKTLTKGLKITAAALVLLITNHNGWSQPWTYDFGTATNSYNTASGNSTSFFSSTPTNGGTYRIRCASSPNQGSGFTLANPGTTLGSETELQINASVNTSTNKFGVYDWSSPTTVAYVKCKYRTTSSGNGNLNFSLGNSTIVTDNNNYTSHYNNSLTSFTITYSSGSISSVVRRISGSNTTISSHDFSKDANQVIEIYANNDASSKSYIRGGNTYTLATKTWDLWVDGTRTVTGAATAGSLAAGTKLSGFGFFAESSTGNAAYIYIDDLEYSNSLPNLPTVTTTAISLIKKATASSGGNVTNNGGASVTARGVCWSISSNPTLADSYTTDGTGTGSFSSSITGLSPNTPYYVRAYATNAVGTAYGDEISFNTQKATETVSTTTTWSSLSNVGDETDVTVSGTLTVNTLGECNNLTVTDTGEVTINNGQGLIINGDLLLESSSSGTASLIHNSSDISITGTTTIERYLPSWPNSTSTQGWHLLSSPVSGHALTNFTPTPATSYDFFAWDEATNNWLDQKLPTNNITQFTLGKGYLTAYENAGVRNFTGIINTTDVNAPVTYTASGPGLRGWNLVGNPFTSAIDVTYYSAWTKTNLTDYLYVWDDANGNYKYWNGESGNLSVIPAMQGFWVRATAASPSLTIPASKRIHSSQNFYKSSPLANQLKLKVQSFNGFYDEAFVYFNQNNTNGNDINKDVPKLYGSVQEAPQLYTFIGTDKVSVNAMGNCANTSILLGFEPRKNGNFTITASELNSFGCGAKIILEDTKTNTTQDLMVNPIYNFSANTSDNVNRFVLHFDFSAVAVSDIIKDNIAIFAFDNNIYINTGEQIKQISVYNTLGQLVKKLDNVSGIQKINLDNNSTGYYIVNVVTNKNVITQKVLIK